SRTVPTRVAQRWREREHDLVRLVACDDVAYVTRPLGPLAGHRREYSPGPVPPRVEHLRDLVGGESDPVPRDVVGEALEAAGEIPESVDRRDDLPPQLVLRRVAQVGSARGLQRGR